jgi:hypothetical protein
MGAWTEIVDYTVPSNTTSVVLNDFGTITKDDFIKVVVNPVSSSTDYYYQYFPNTAVGVTGFNTSSNYTSQYLAGYGSSVSANRFNLNIATYSGLSSSFAISYVKLSENGKFNIFTNEFVDLATPQTIFRYTTSSNLTFNDPITSLTITASRTDAIGTGSRIQIYRLDAEKVADITVASNTTQVDISSLSIGKDDEYLLVADFDGVASPDCRLRLMVNDNTTITNYYEQFIAGLGTGTLAGRLQDPIIANTSPTNDSLAYVHIKLSEIGAYTAQAYELRGIGLSTVSIINAFISSTAENITSITKLNLVAQVTNGIGSGTRFLLYKLK